MAGYRFFQANGIILVWHEDSRAGPTGLTGVLVAELRLKIFFSIWLNLKSQCFCALS